MAEQHTILGGTVYVYKIPNSKRWQCSSYFADKNRRTRTKEESLSNAHGEVSGSSCDFSFLNTSHRARPAQV
jgi:hypothetical protein